VQQQHAEINLSYGLALARKLFFDEELWLAGIDASEC
jgi:hypothetical protein